MENSAIVLGVLVALTALLVFLKSVNELKLSKIKLQEVATSVTTTPRLSHSDELWKLRRIGMMLSALFFLIAIGLLAWLMMGPLSSSPLTVGYSAQIVLALIIFRQSEGFGRF